jgi:hypothetical protein
MADSPFDFLPRQRGARFAHEVSLPAGEFFLLPVIKRNGIGSACEIIPQVLDKLELLRRA